MNIYLSGASAELPRLEVLSDRITDETRLRVDRKWMVQVKKLRAQGKTDRDLTPRAARKAAERDLRAVERCEIFVLVVPKRASRGAWVELGVAVAAQKFTIVVGKPTSIFCQLADVLIPNENALISYLSEPF